MAIEAGDDISVGVRFQHDMTAQAGGNGRWRDPPPSLFSGSAQAGMTLRYGGETELVRFPTAADLAIRALPEHRKVGPVRNGDRNAAVPERSL